MANDEAAVWRGVNDEDAAELRITGGPLTPTLYDLARDAGWSSEELFQWDTAAWAAFRATIPAPRGAKE